MYEWLLISHQYIHGSNHKAEQVSIQQDLSILKLRRAPSGGVVSLWVYLNGQM